jgi:dolichyl-diphosphooligosaccharide--protein glycosyltransferase
MNCRESRIDLSRGIVSDGANYVPLLAALYVNNGYIVNRKDYVSNQGYYLQVLMKNNEIFDVQLVEPRLFWTNFNQQYLLGNYDKRYFEEVYNNFPVARVLKVKQAGRVSPQAKQE